MLSLYNPFDFLCFPYVSHNYMKPSHGSNGKCFELKENGLTWAWVWPAGSDAKGWISIRDLVFDIGSPGRKDIFIKWRKRLKHVDSYDPWLEIDATTFQHNVREVARLAGGRPVMAVIKNNAYGLGDEIVGPILDSCRRPIFELPIHRYRIHQIVCRCA